MNQIILDFIGSEMSGNLYRVHGKDYTTPSHNYFIDVDSRLGVHSTQEEIKESLHTVTTDYYEPITNVGSVKIYDNTEFIITLAGQNNAS